ncbi:MAG: TetR/AcrR family transcriptional regulator [Casimicrobiaceae bacterium]
MPRDASTTKRQIIDAAYELFYKEGFAHVGVDAIAKAAGITKRTLYYHFDSKDTLIGKVLQVQHELMLERIGRWAKRSSWDPVAMIEAIFTDFAAWSRQPGWRGSGLTRAAIEFARSPGHPARIAARRHKAAVERMLVDQFAACDIEAPTQLVRQLMLLIEGCNSLILIHGDPSYADAALQAARLLVGQHGSNRARPIKRRLPIGPAVTSTRRR